MTEGRAKRKLTAILSADVVGYSRLMGEDELATVETLKKYRKVIFSHVSQYNGRVVDSPGDNILAEFGSAVDAVECAVTIQAVLEKENLRFTEERRMVFRIGVNLGDVIHDEGRIYGDGINVAARLEALADPGSVFISGTVHDQVDGKLDLEFEFQGEKQVKNIIRPIKIYSVSISPFLSSVDEDLKIGLDETVLTLPDKPSIAVLPFTNMSGDPTQEYISDGITENIIATLSIISEMFVIARNSTFVYKGKSVKVQEVGRSLGVRYILEGSVQKAGNNLRITAQLIDAPTGHHMWAERYDRSMKDFFTLQDEITREIVTALQIELTEGERARAYRNTDNFEAWSYVVQAVSCFRRFTREDNAKARDLAIKATQLDPEYVSAWTILGWTHAMDSSFGTGEMAERHFMEAVTLSEKAAAMDDSSAEVHSLLSYVRLFERKYDEAISEGKKAADLDPNNVNSHSLLGHAMLFAGDFSGAIKMYQKAIRLGPYSHDWDLLNLGNAYFMSEKYKEAIYSWKRHHMLLKKQGFSERRFIIGHIGLVASYIRLGSKQLAKKHLKEIFRLNPNFSLENMRKQNPYRDPNQLEHLISALREAGLK